MVMTMYSNRPSVRKGSIRDRVEASSNSGHVRSDYIPHRIEMTLCAKLGHDANKKALKEKAAPSAALHYRTMWCRPVLFARLFTTDPTAAR